MKKTPEEIEREIKAQEAELQKLLQVGTFFLTRTNFIENKNTSDYMHVISVPKFYKFHVHQCQAQIEILRSPDIQLTFVGTSPDLLIIILPSPDPYKTLT